MKNILLIIPLLASTLGSYKTTKKATNQEVVVTKPITREQCNDKSYLEIQYYKHIANLNNIQSHVDYILDKKIKCLKKVEG